MTAVEDDYHARIETILGIHLPTAGENRVFMLETPEWNTIPEARELLARIKRQVEDLNMLAEEVGQAEHQYRRSLFGKQKRLDCQAVLMVLAQIIPALSRQRAEITLWVAEHSQAQPLWPTTAEMEQAPSDQDELYRQAVVEVRKAGRASVSLLQRRLRIGYSRGARLIDELENKGVIGPDLGASRGREVFPEDGLATNEAGGQGNQHVGTIRGPKRTDRCPRCGKLASSGDHFCSECGQQLA